MSSNTEGVFTTGSVSEKESMEYFIDGLKQASSAARQLAMLQSHGIWADISKMLDEMNNSGVRIANSKPLSRQETIHILDERETRMSLALDAQRTKVKPKIIMS